MSTFVAYKIPCCEIHVSVSNTQTLTFWPKFFVSFSTSPDRGIRQSGSGTLINDQSVVEKQSTKRTDNSNLFLRLTVWLLMAVFSFNFYLLSMLFTVVLPTSVYLSIQSFSSTHDWLFYLLLQVYLFRPWVICDCNYFFAYLCSTLFHY